MRLSSIAVIASLTALIHSASVTANRYMACLYKTDGETCTNEDGQQSRCSPLYSCRSLPTPCGAGAKDLQPCGDGYTEFCFPFLGPELRCLNKMEISANLKFDACAGKPDGTPCKAPYLETLYTGAAALYEQNGRCSGQVCFSPGTVACQGKAIGQGCDFEGALNRKTYRFSGTCQQEYKSLYEPNCNVTSQTYVGPATPIKSHPGRDATGPPAPAPEPTQAPTSAPATEAPKPTTAAPEPTTLRPVTSAPPATTKPVASSSPATTPTPTPMTERVSGSRPGSSDSEIKQETTAPSMPQPEILPKQTTTTPMASRTPLPTLSSAASAADVTTVLATAAAAAVMMVQV
ncbi:hypothetical protein PINS_up011709 [Pythium insidiosum]|nr:hypothetical protein PINS_up011709 [Pythium insidiosum]